MKLISIQEAKKLINNGEKIFLSNTGFLSIVDKNMLNIIKNGDMYDPSNPFNGIINTKDYYYSNGSDLAFMCGENVSSIKKLYKLDDSKNLYSLYIYDSDDVYSPNKYIDISYYETYDNMKKIYKDIVNKFLIAKFGSDISEIDKSSMRRYENDDLYINEDSLFMHFSINTLSGYMISYDKLNDKNKYVVSFRINNLLEGK